MTVKNVFRARRIFLLKSFRRKSIITSGGIPQYAKYHKHASRRKRPHLRTAWADQNERTGAAQNEKGTGGQAEQHGRRARRRPYQQKNARQGRNHRCGRQNVGAHLTTLQRAGEVQAFVVFIAVLLENNR